jgi:hypothetical protein
MRVAVPRIGILQHPRAAAAARAPEAVVA